MYSHQWGGESVATSNEVVEEGRGVGGGGGLAFGIQGRRLGVEVSGTVHDRVWSLPQTLIPAGVAGTSKVVTCLGLNPRP